MAGMRLNRFGGALVAASLLVSSTGAAASINPAPVQQVNPWAALAVMSGAAPASVLCGSAAIAAAAQAPASGCVLPVTQTPPVAAQSEPPTPIPVPPVEPASAGLGVSPLLLALGAIIAGVGVYLLVQGHSNSPA